MSMFPDMPTKGPAMFYIANTKLEDLHDYIKVLCSLKKVKKYKFISDCYVYIIFENNEFEDLSELIEYEKKSEFDNVKGRPDFAGKYYYWTRDGNVKDYSNDYIKELCSGNWVVPTVKSTTSTTPHVSVPTNKINEITI